MPESKAEIFAGVQLSPSRITAVTFDRALHPLGKTKRSTKAERGAESVASRIARTVIDAVDEADGELSDLAAVGIAVCAEFDPRFANASRRLAADWGSAALEEALRKQLGVPVDVVTPGAACALGLRADPARNSQERLAVVLFEEELAGAMLEGEVLLKDFDQIVVGEDRWIDWEPSLRNLPGKKRYRKLARLLAKEDPWAQDLFGRVAAQLIRVLKRGNRFKPDAVALVGLGAEELKDPLLEAIAKAEGLEDAHCVIPAAGTSACQVGAAAWAIQRAASTLRVEG